MLMMLLFRAAKMSADCKTAVGFCKAKWQGKAMASDHQHRWVQSEKDDDPTHKVMSAELTVATN